VYTERFAKPRPRLFDSLAATSPCPVHYGTDMHRQIGDDDAAPLNRREPMLIVIGGVLVAWAAAVIIRRIRVPGGVNAANLGEVSEQWLAEHRASHPL